MEVEAPLLGVLNGELDLAIMPSTDVADGVAQGLPLVALAGHANHAADGSYGGSMLVTSADRLSQEPSTIGAFLIAYVRGLQELADDPAALAFAPFDGGFGARDDEGGIGELSTYLTTLTGSEPDLQALIEERPISSLRRGGVCPPIRRRCPAQMWLPARMRLPAPMRRLPDGWSNGARPSYGRTPAFGDRSASYARLHRSVADSGQPERSECRPLRSSATISAQVVSRRNGKPVRNQVVRWALARSASGGDGLSATSTVTDRRGRTSVTMKFGPAAGSRTVTAGATNTSPSVTVRCAGGLPRTSPRPPLGYSEQPSEILLPSWMCHPQASHFPFGVSAARPPGNRPADRRG